MTGFAQDVEVVGRSGNPDAHLAVHGADCTTPRHPTACEGHPDSTALFSEIMLSRGEGEETLEIANGVRRIAVARGLGWESVPVKIHG